MITENLPDFVAMTRREIEDYLVERAMVQPHFRAQLLAQPDQTLRELGLPVGPDVRIRVFEEEPKSFYLVLPRVLPDLEEGEEAAKNPTAERANQNPDFFRFFHGYT